MRLEEENEDRPSRENQDQRDVGLLEIQIHPETYETIEVHNRLPNDDVYRITRMQPDKSSKTKVYLPRKTATGWALVEQ